MGVGELPRWRVLPPLGGIWSRAGVALPVGALQVLSALAARVAPGLGGLQALGDRIARALLRYEALYALPAILLLVLSFDSTLARAWNLSGASEAWWHAIALDRQRWLLWLAMALPLAAWAARFWTIGRLAVVTGPDVGLFLYLTGAQIGFTQTLAVDGSRTRLLGIVAAIYLYYLIYHQVADGRSLRRWLHGTIGAAAALALLTLSLLGFDLPASRSSELLQPVLDGLAPLSLGPIYHLYFFPVSQRLVVNPNGVADLAMVVAILTIGAALASGRPWQRAVWAIGGGAALVTLLGAGTRTALLGLVAGIAIILLRRRQYWLVVLMPFGLVVLLSTAMPATKIAQLWELWQSDAAIARFQVWSAYGGLIQQQPLSGAGLGLYSVALEYAGHYGLDLYFSDPHAHNVILQTYLEQTALGLAGLLLLLYAVHRIVTRGTERSMARQDTTGHAARSIAVACWAAMVGLVVHNLFDINLNTNAITALLFALAALAVRAAQIAAGASPSAAEADCGTAQEARLLYVASARAAAWMVAGLLVVVTLLSGWPLPYAPHIYIR